MLTKPRDNFISWDECFIRIAQTIAERSKDPSTQAGAVIVTPDNIVVGLGYNGFPRGVENDTFPWDRNADDMLKSKYTYMCHAEENATYNANNSTKGCKIYTTLFPCNECAKTIIQNGMVEVIYESDKYHDKPAFTAARIMFDAAGVSYRQYISNISEMKHTL